MENEFIDEARRCPTCGVVTYCDNCPICGKKLPRSNPVLHRFQNAKVTAGEEESYLQPNRNKDFTAHMENRSANENKKEALFEKADHIDPKQILQYRKRTTKKASNADMNRKVVFVFAIIIILAVLCIIVGRAYNRHISTEVSNLHSYQGYDYDGSIDERTSIRENHGDIACTNYTYTESNEESILSMVNYGDRSLQTDVYLYDGDEKIGYYSDVFILPHESFDLSIYTDTVADSYELKNYIFYENDSTKPDFDYVTFNDYGTAQVEVERSLDKEDMEILVTYLYQASLMSDQGELYSFMIRTPTYESYEVYINNDQNSATVYELDDYDHVDNSYEITVGNKRGSSTGMSL